MSITSKMKQQSILPHEMLDYLRNDNGHAVLDKLKYFSAKQLVMQRITQMFFTMAEVYKWDYKVPYNDATIYFETEDNEIYGGIYDLKNHIPINRLKVATDAQRVSLGVYIYATPELNEMIAKILQATS